MSFIKKYWWVIVLFIAFPFFVNFAVTRTTPFDCTVAGEPKDWLMLWGGYIGGFASFVMLFVAWRTLMENKSANRPHIHIRIIRKFGILYLECNNIGKSTALNIKIEFPKEFIKAILLDVVKSNILEIEKYDFPLPVDAKKYIKLCFGKLDNRLLDIYGSDSKEKTITFNGEKIKMIDSNANLQYFNDTLKYIKVHYNNEYNERIPIDTSSYEEIEQDMMRVIACRLEGIENYLETIANKK